MLVNYLAKNKVEGFAAVKGTGLLIMLPMLVYYVPRQLNFILGIIPGYWPAMAIGAINGHGYATMPYWVYGVIGCVYIIGLCMLLLKGFKKKIMV
jgi:fluoroquinolone transport system permease protein